MLFGVCYPLTWIRFNQEFSAKIKYRIRGSPYLSLTFSGLPPRLSSISGSSELCSHFFRTEKVHVFSQDLSHSMWCQLQTVLRLKPILKQGSLLPNALFLPAFTHSLVCEVVVSHILSVERKCAPTNLFLKFLTIVCLPSFLLRFSPYIHLNPFLLQ